MTIEKQTLSILQHFSKFATSVKIEPGKALYVQAPEKYIHARARIEHGFTETIPCQDIGMFVSLFNLFDGLDYNIDYKTGALIIKSTDGRLEQECLYGEEAVLQIPQNTDNMDKLLEKDLDVEFELDSESLKLFNKALSTNGSTAVVFEVKDGVISMFGGNTNLAGEVEKTSNSFKLELGKTTANDIQVHVLREHFMIANGDYKVGIDENFVRYLSETVDYINPTL